MTQLLVSDDEFYELVRAASKPRQNTLKSESVDYILGTFDKCNWQRITRNATPDDLLYSKNWVWDRTTQTFIWNIMSGYHEFLLSHLYLLYTGTENDARSHDHAGDYIREGYGFSLSSVGNNPHKGAEVKLTAQEKRIFRGLKFVDVE
jgi:hypothetical protein